MDQLRFLSTEDVMRLHADTLEHEGGCQGVKDFGLLDSAVHMPRQMFCGEYLHPSLPSMASAYLFHIASNQALNDGNKRAGAMASLAFLYENGVDFQPPADELEKATLAVAACQMTKDELTQWFEQWWPR